MVAIPTFMFRRTHLPTVLVLDGDSVTADWAPGLIGARQYLTVHDVSRGGSTINSGGGNRLEGQRTLRASFLGSGSTRNLCVFASGVNDFGNSISSSTYLSQAATLISETISDGFAGVIWGGIQAVSETQHPGFEAFRVACNAGLTAMVGSTILGLIPFHIASAWTGLGLPDLSPASAADNLTYWGSDGIHPTGTGATAFTTLANDYLLRFI